MLVTASHPPLVCINSAGVLSTPADFPFFADLTAASTSSRRIGKLSYSVFIGQSNTAAFPLVCLLYNSVQYSVHRLTISFSSVRHVPYLWCLFLISSHLSDLLRLEMLFCYCSCSGCLLFRCTVLLSIFFGFFHASSDFFVDFPIFISSSGASSFSVLFFGHTCQVVRW